MVSVEGGATCQFKIRKVFFCSGELCLQEVFLPPGTPSQPARWEQRVASAPALYPPLFPSLDDQAVNVVIFLMFRPGRELFSGPVGGQDKPKSRLRSGILWVAWCVSHASRRDSLIWPPVFQPPSSSVAGIPGWAGLENSAAGRESRATTLEMKRARVADLGFWYVHDFHVS